MQVQGGNCANFSSLAAPLPEETVQVHGAWLRHRWELCQCNTDIAPPGGIQSDCNFTKVRSYSTIVTARSLPRPKESISHVMREEADAKEGCA